MFAYIIHEFVFIRKPVHIFFDHKHTKTGCDDHRKTYEMEIIRIKLFCFCGNIHGKHTNDTIFNEVRLQRGRTWLDFSRKCNCIHHWTVLIWLSLRSFSKDSPFFLIGVCHFDRRKFCDVFISTARILLPYETWMLELDSEHYGVLRCFGALGLTIGSPIAGYLVSHFSYISLLISFSIISIVLLYLIKTSSDAKKNGRAMRMEDIKGFFKNKRYLLLVCIYLFIYMIGTADQYVVIDKMLDIHANSTQIGIKWALQSFMEAPLFLISAKILKRFKPFTLLWFGTVMYAVKFFLYGFFHSPWLIIGTAGLQIVTLPIIMLTSKLLIKEVSGEKVASSAQMFAMAVFIGFSGLITPLITSFLASSIGYDMTLYLVAIFSIVPLLLIFYYKKINQKMS